MTSFKELFIDLKPMPQSTDIANSASMNVTGIGNVQLDVLTSTGEQLRVELHNVIYAPTSPYNLLSVSQILSRGHTLIMNKSERCIRIHDRISIPISLDSSGLPSVVVALPHLFIMWASICLGHLNYRDMYRLSQSCESLPSLPATVKHLCDTCELAKARRQPFPASDTPAVPRRLQLLHMDTLTFEVPSLNGHRYALIIVDYHKQYGYT
jgi:hypothetical protein